MTPAITAAITPAMTGAANTPTPAASTAAGAILPGLGMVLPGAPADQADAAMPPAALPPAAVPHTEFAAVLLPAMALAGNGPTPFAAAEPPAVPHADGAPAATLAQAGLPDQATEDEPAPPAWVMALIPELAAIVAGRPQDAGQARAPAGVAGAKPMPWPPAPVTAARLPLVTRPAPDWQRSLPGAPAAALAVPGDAANSARDVPPVAAPAAALAAITTAATPAEPGIGARAQPAAAAGTAPVMPPPAVQPAALAATATPPLAATATPPLAATATPPLATPPAAPALPLPDQLPPAPVGVLTAAEPMRGAVRPARAARETLDIAPAVPADAASVAAAPAPAVALAAPAAQPATPPAAQPASLPAAAPEPAITMPAGNLGDVAVSLSGGPDALNVAMTGAPAAAALIDAQGQRLSQELANAGITLATLTVNGQRTDLGGGQRRQQPPRGEQPDPVAVRARRAPALLPAVNPALAASLTIDRFA